LHYLCPLISVTCLKHTTLLTLLHTQVLHASASTEHARRTAEVEKIDLMNTYRAVLHEKRKLEEDVTNLR
jgi:hypothetical protein